MDRVHESFINEFGKRRQIAQDRKQNIVNNRFPSLAEARDQYLKQTFQAPQRINDETTQGQSASYDEVNDPSGSPQTREETSNPNAGKDLSSH